MRSFLTVALATAILSGAAFAGDVAKQAPKVVLRSADGKTTYDLAKLTADGPVLVRLTCTCSGCDQELPYFQKLQAAYEAKGLKTLAVFREKSGSTGEYIVKNDIRFLCVEDPKGETWKTFDAKSMPTNILVDKNGRVVKMIGGCAKDGKNAQALSAEIAKLLHTQEAKIVKN